MNKFQIKCEKNCVNLHRCQQPVGLVMYPKRALKSVTLCLAWSFLIEIAFVNGKQFDWIFKKNTQHRRENMRVASMTKRFWQKQTILFLLKNILSQCRRMLGVVLLLIFRICVCVRSLSIHVYVVAAHNSMPNKCSTKIVIAHMQTLNE